MARLRHVSGGKWNKLPVLTAARRILIEALSSHSTTRPLGEMAEFVNGTSYRSDLLAVEGTPIIRISNITDPKSDFLRTDESFEDRYKVDTGDLLVSWSASFKSIIWPGPPSVLNQHIFRVRERSPNNKSFIRHAIEAVFDEMQQKVVGIGMMHLRRQDFIGHEIPCPSPEIQLAVSEYLDWIESGGDGEEPSLPKLLDEERRIVSRIEELAAKIRAARGLRGQAHKSRPYLWQSLAEHFLNRKPQWPARRLRDLVSLKGGGTPSKSNPEYWQGCVPWVSPKDMKTRELYDSEDHISKGATTETSARLLDPNCVLIVVRGMILAHTVPAAILRVPAAINQDMKAMVPIIGILPEYICACIWAFNPRLLDLIEKSTHDTRKLETEKLLDFAIPVPPPQEQIHAVSRLNDLYCKVGTIEKLQSETAAELDALMPSILLKAFRGEL